MSLYETDYLAWADQQAALARSRSGNGLDWDNVAEELTDLGNQVRAQLENRYAVLLLHLLKWRYQADRRTASWESTIKVQRVSIAKLIRKNPSLKAADAEEFADAYVTARIEAGFETQLGEDAFPQEPPFTPDEARDARFWPDPE